MTDEVSRRPGGRTARVRRQVLDALEAELLEHGVSALSVDAVARRAGVHRATVFRRWHDVGGLLADAFDAATEDDWRPGDHGSLEADLVALGTEIADGIGEQSLSRALIAAAHQSAPAADALHRFLADRYDRCAPVIDRARARGELPAAPQDPDPADPDPTDASDPDAHRLLVLATAPVYHLVLHLGRVPDRAEIDTYARCAIAGSGRRGV